MLPIDLNERGRDTLMANPGEGAKAFSSNYSVKISEKPEFKLDTHMNSSTCQADVRFPDVPFSPDQYKHSQNPPLQRAKSLSDTNEQTTKTTVYEKKETTKKNKSKRDSSSKFINNKTMSAKRSKEAEEAEIIPYKGSKDGAHSVNSQHRFPKKSWQDQFKSNNAEWSGSKDIETQDYSLANHNRSVTFENTRKIHQSPELWSSSRADVQKPGS